MNHSVEIKNHELTLETIRRETTEAADSLTKILEQTKAAELKLETAKADAKAELERVAAAHRALDGRTAEVTKREQEHEAGKDRRRSEIRVVEDQRKNAMRDLSNIQEWILGANAEYEKKQGELRAITADIEEAKKHAERILEIENELKGLEPKLLEANINLTLARAEYATVTESTANLIADAKKRVEEADQKVADAKTELQSTLDRKGQVCADLELYIQRIEEHYQKAFPGLRMII